MASAVSFKANSAGIPLFVMPWEINLVAVIQEITYLIIDRNTADEKSRHFLENLLFSPAGTVRQCGGTGSVL